jgi:DNA cross-link repair 1C protein
MGIYSSLVSKASNSRFGSEYQACPEAAALVGHMCGNTRQEGCLTLDHNVRLHSCEKGNYCQTIWKHPVVWIQPIVSHVFMSGDILEAGVGGGGDDLQKEVELEVFDRDDVQSVLSL